MELDHTPPVFVEKLKDITACDGQEVSLHCVVSGKPMPVISWYHNDENIDKSQDYVFTYDRLTGKVYLVILDCFPDDEGHFMCIAENVAGRATTKCYLTVCSEGEAAKPESNDQQMAKRVFDEKVKLESRVPKKVEKVGSNVDPPQFSDPLKPVVVHEGNSYTLVAVVTGYPSPSVQWTKDGEEIKAVDHFDIKFDRVTGTCMLKVPKAAIDDSGLYSCRAFNKAGRSTSTANVVVIRKLAVFK